MKIQCESVYRFVEVIHGLVEKGLTFEAVAESLVIRLTGGYLFLSLIVYNELVVWFFYWR